MGIHWEQRRCFFLPNCTPYSTYGQRIGVCGVVDLVPAIEDNWEVK